MIAVGDSVDEENYDDDGVGNDWTVRSKRRCGSWAGVEDDGMTTSDKQQQKWCIGWVG